MFKWMMGVVALLISAPALANPTILSMQQQLDQFKKDPLALYAPMTLARAQAYLGAAMLARDGHNDADEALALSRSETTLSEAKANAQRFNTTFSALLSLHAKTSAVLAVLPNLPNEEKGVSAHLLMENATLVMKKVIRASEVGQLNESQALAVDASQALQSVLKVALPDLAEMTRKTLSKAAMMGGKNYAPVTYAQAKDGLAALKAYVDQKEGTQKESVQKEGVKSGDVPSMPENPASIYQLAQQALDISVQVKEWRGDKGSHEMLELRNQMMRQRIAQALHLDVSAGADANVGVDVLEKEIAALYVRLQKNERMYQANVAALEKQCRDEKQKALSEQQLSLVAEKNTQMSSMKDAFRAKLERETFEIKRQKRLRAMFPADGVEIISNLDGSLLVRLAMLQFSSNSSKLDATFFDLLGHVKDAMEMYGDRTFRVEGHTDSLGDLKENQKLSLQRAESVRDFLIAAGVDASNIKALGYGEVRPIASNEFAKGREMNRRIDVVIESRHE